MDIFTMMVFGETFVIMVLIAIIMMVYSITKPVLIPYLKAHFGKKDLVILADHSNKIRLLPVKYSTGLFTVAQPPWTFLQKLPKSYTLGNIRCVLVSDKWGVVMDPDALQALSTLNDLGYKNYETIEHAMKLWEKTNGEQGIDPDAKILIRAFHEIRLQDVFQYITEITPSSVRAHIEENTADIAQEYARKMKAMMGKKTDMNPTLIIMIIIIVVLIIGGLVLSGGMGGLKLPGL